MHVISGIPLIRLRLLSILVVLLLITSARLYNNYIINQDLNLFNDLENSYEEVLGRTDDYIIDDYGNGSMHIRSKLFLTLSSKIDSIQKNHQINSEHTYRFIDSILIEFPEVAKKIKKSNLRILINEDHQILPFSADLIRDYLHQINGTYNVNYNLNIEMIRKILQMLKILSYGHHLGVSTDCFPSYYSILLKYHPERVDSIDIFVSELRAGIEGAYPISISYKVDDKIITQKPISIMDLLSTY